MTVTYVLSPKVQRVLDEEAITMYELYQMLNSSAITSLRGFNRRFYHWLFKFEKCVLLDMQHVDLVEVGSGDSKMMEEHEDCSGQGCKSCGWVGEIGRWVKDKEVAKHEPLKMLKGV